MARPSEPLVPDGPAAWNTVETWRKANGLTVAQMAEKLEFVSVESYRSRRWREQMPVRQWTAFQRQYGGEIEYKSQGAYLPGYMIDSIEDLGEGNFSEGVRRLWRAWHISR